MTIDSCELCNNYIKFNTSGSSGNLYKDKNRDIVLKIFRNKYMLNNRKVIIEKLLSITYVENSGYPVDLLYLDGNFCGYVSKYFADSFMFDSKEIEMFSFREKIKAIFDVDSQLKVLHDNDIIFHDMNSSNLLIDNNGGHIIDFEDVRYKGLCGRFLSKYLLEYDGREIFFSKKEDQLKLLVSIFSLLFDYDLEEYFLGFDPDISILADIVSNDKIIYEFVISCLLELNNKNSDTLPYFSEILGDLDEDRVNYDKRLVKSKLV